MANYYNRGGGCIHGDCQAQTKDTIKSVRDLRKGDLVKNHLGGYSKITCVLTTKV